MSYSILNFKWFGLGFFQTFRTFCSKATALFSFCSHKKVNKQDITIKNWKKKWFSFCVHIKTNRQDIAIKTKQKWFSIYVHIKANKKDIAIEEKNGYSLIWQCNQFKIFVIEKLRKYKDLEMKTENIRRVKTLVLTVRIWRQDMIK